MEAVLVLEGALTSLAVLHIVCVLALSPSAWEVHRQGYEDTDLWITLAWIRELVRGPEVEVGCNACVPLGGPKAPIIVHIDLSKMLEHLESVSASAVSIPSSCTKARDKTRGVRGNLRHL